MGIDPPAQLGLNLTGNGVNVVVIDSGLDVSLIPAGQWGGGWQLRSHWTTSGDDNGRRRAARHDGRAEHPRRRTPAVIWDVPLIRPPRINRLGLFLSGAQVTFG